MEPAVEEEAEEAADADGRDDDEGEFHGQGEFAWTRWELAWTPSGPGHTTIAARAKDSTGNVQPVRAEWNKFGYLMNAIATRGVTIQP